MTTLYDLHGIEEANAALRQANVSLTLENRKLRAALEAVEWIDGECAWCGNPRYNNNNGDPISHAPDCQRQAALGLTEPAP